jgi:uncharacterized membrane protein YoaK (UPF0700 family)
MPLDGRRSTMTFFSSIADAASWRDERHGPLPLMLLNLTMVTGLVDSVSYLQLGHVFVANMTGNVVFLGFAMADPAYFSIPASLLAIAAFLAGALVGGRAGSRLGQHRARLLAMASYIKIGLVGAALVVSIVALDSEAALARYALVALLGLAMGVQNAVARRLGVLDLTTTVLTLTLTGLAADSTLAGGKNANPGRRILATLIMFLGAAIGAVLILHVGVSAVLALTLALLAVNGIAAHLLSSSTAPWTTGT